MFELERVGEEKAKKEDDDDNDDDDDALVELSLRVDGVRVQCERIVIPSHLPAAYPETSFRMALDLVAMCDQLRSVLPVEPGGKLQGQIDAEFLEWFAKEAEELPLKKELEMMRQISRAKAAGPAAECLLM